MSKNKITNHHKEEIILAKAIKKISDIWSITNKQIGEFFGLSEPTVSRLKSNKYLIDYNSKQWQLAVIFLRVFRGLDAYMGGNIKNETEWLKSHNTALGGVPLDLMKTVEGLTNVVQYIDYMRGQ